MNGLPFCSIGCGPEWHYNRIDRTIRAGERRRRIEFQKKLTK